MLGHGYVEHVKDVAIVSRRKNVKISDDFAKCCADFIKALSACEIMWYRHVGRTKAS